jgi:hypothetical protein
VVHADDNAIVENDNSLREDNQMRAALAGLACVLAEVASAVAAPAPDIVGKSVLVTWTEYRQLQIAGQPANVTLGYDLRFYVSSAGRPFTRLTLTGRPGRTAMNEQVGGTGTSLVGGLRVVSVDGHAVVLQGIMGNFARNLRVEVAPGGSSCSAQMLVGKEVGSTPKTVIGPLTGAVTEIHAITVNGVSCAVQQGNVFAN